MLSPPLLLWRTKPDSRPCQCRCIGPPMAFPSEYSSSVASATRPHYFAWRHSLKMRSLGKTDDHLNSADVRLRLPAAVVDARSRGRSVHLLSWRAVHVSELASGSGPASGPWVPISCTASVAQPERTMPSSTPTMWRGSQRRTVLRANRSPPLSSLAIPARGVGRSVGPRRSPDKPTPVHAPLLASGASQTIRAGLLPCSSSFIEPGGVP